MHIMLRLSRRYGDWRVLFNTPVHALFLSLMQNSNQSKFLQHLGFCGWDPLEALIVRGFYRDHLARQRRPITNHLKSNILMYGCFVFLTMLFNKCAVEFAKLLYSFFLFQIKLTCFYKSGTCIKIKILMAIWWSMIYNDDEGGGDELLATDKWWSRFCDKQLLREAGMYSLSGEIVARVCSFVTHFSLKYIASKQSKHRHPSLSLACVLVQLLMRGLMSCNLLQIVPLPSARHQNKRTPNPTSCYDYSYLSSSPKHLICQN